VGLSILFIFRFGFGVLGLAAATSIASLVQFLALFIFLDYNVGGFERKRVITSFLKMSLATGVTAVFLWVPMRVLDRFVFNTQKTLDLVILTGVASFIGLAVYFLLSLILQIEELKVIASLVKKLGKWREILEQSEEIIEPEIE
jgi:peptidoglycan biosynthesis protein MviN/MurJ (putative lipid II flippase)